MHRRRAFLGLALVLLAAGLPLRPSAAETPALAPWRLTVLRPLAPGQSTIVNDISESGIAVGRSGGQPVVWNANGDPFPLPLPTGGISGEATAINETGTVVGQVFGEPSRGVAWRASGVTVLGSNLLPTDVNDAGGVTGAEIVGGQYRHGFVMLVDGERTRLYTGEEDFVLPQAMTEWGFVVGDVHDQQAGVGQGRGWLGSFSFRLWPDPSLFFTVADVLESGWVLINVGPPNSAYHAALLTGDGKVHSIHGTGRATDINEYGVIIGQRDVPQPLGQPKTAGTISVYGATFDLEALLDRPAGSTPDLGRPEGINDRAWIVGNTTLDATKPTAVSQSWLLRPPG